MMAEVARLCDAVGLPRLMGAADPLERDAPYFAWRTVLSSVLAGGPVAPEERQGRNLPTAHGARPVGARAAPSNPLLSLSLPETPATRELSGPLRGENTRELLLGCPRGAQRAGADRRAHRRRPLVRRRLVVARHQGPNAATKPPPGPDQRGSPEPPLPAELVALLAEGGRLELGPLAPADALVLARHRLGVEGLSPDVARLISERGGGHPYFTEELAYALRDSGGSKSRRGWPLWMAPGRSMPPTCLPPSRG